MIRRFAPPPILWTGHRGYRAGSDGRPSKRYTRSHSYSPPWPERKLGRDELIRRGRAVEYPPTLDAAILPALPIFKAIARHDPNSTAVVHSISGRTFKYGPLLGHVARTRNWMREAAWDTDLRGQRVAFIVENSYDYVVTLLAALAARAVAVPLAPNFSHEELHYILKNSDPFLLACSPRNARLARELRDKTHRRRAEPACTPLALPLPKLLGGKDEAAAVTLSDSDCDEGDQGDLMLYTSGTTKMPKGVILPHSALAAQVQSLIEAWQYTSADRLLHVLPLNHIHGVVNALLTPLVAGSSIEFMHPFRADQVWNRLAEPFTKPSPDAGATANADANALTDAGADATTAAAAAHANAKATAHADLKAYVNTTLRNDYRSREDADLSFLGSWFDDTPKPSVVTRAPPPPVTFFTAVPTIYDRLLASHATLPPELREPARDAISPANMRLAIAGSAPLSIPIKTGWRDLSRGTVLLERYGMTEVGMALSCGLDPLDRVDTSVGWPLPGVEARLVDTETGAVLDPDDEKRGGEIQIRGKTIFSGYWANEEAYAESFVADPDGGAPWFKTGDVAVRRPNPNRQAATDSKTNSEPNPEPNPETEIKSKTKSKKKKASKSKVKVKPWTPQGPMFFIQGRQSADIIKTGGEKVSALEVEHALLALPEVAEAAVVGLPSATWGQKVAAVVALHRSTTTTNKDENADADADAVENTDVNASTEVDASAFTDAERGKVPHWSALDMRRALRSSLAPHKIPQVLRVVDAIPRSSMGKINKFLLVRDLFPDVSEDDGVASEETAFDGVASEETSSNVASEETASDGVASEETSSNVASEETASDGVASEETSSNVSDDVASGETSDAATSGETSSDVAPEGTSSDDKQEQPPPTS